MATRSTTTVIFTCRTCGTENRGDEHMAACCAQDLLNRFYAGEFDNPHPQDLQRLEDDGAPAPTERA